MVRYFFDSPLSAARALRAVLVHARTSQAEYLFGPLSVPQLAETGMRLSGDTEAIVGILDEIPGAVRQQPVAQVGR